MKTGSAASGGEQRAQDEEEKEAGAASGAGAGAREPRRRRKEKGEVEGEEEAESGVCWHAGRVRWLRCGLICSGHRPRVRGFTLTSPHAAVNVRETERERVCVSVATQHLTYTAACSTERERELGRTI